jgi:hypothetical protein
MVLLAEFGGKAERSGKWAAVYEGLEELGENLKVF